MTNEERQMMMEFIEHGAAAVEFGAAMKMTGHPIDHDSDCFYDASLVMFAEVCCYCRQHSISPPKFDDLFVNPIWHYFYEAEYNDSALAEQPPYYLIFLDLERNRS